MRLQKAMIIPTEVSATVKGSPKIIVIFIDTSLVNLATILFCNRDEKAMLSSLQLMATMVLYDTLPPMMKKCNVLRGPVVVCLFFM